MRLIVCITAGALLTLAPLSPSTVSADWYAQKPTSGAALDGTDVPVNGGLTGTDPRGGAPHGAAGGPLAPRCPTSYRPLDPAGAALLGPGGPEPGTWWVSVDPVFC